jgi:hypothetical protein
MDTETEGALELHTFVDNLLIDTVVETTGELETRMLDIMVGRKVILDPRAAPADPP